MVYVAAIDLGATWIRATVVEETAVVVGSDERRTPHGVGGQALGDAVLTAVRHACDDAGVKPVWLAAVGVGSVGPVDAEAGLVVDPPNLPGVDSVPLVDLLRDLTDLDRDAVAFENDCIAGLRGELAAGAPENTAYVTLSSGVGGGASVDGHVLRGRAGNAAELGHLTVAPDSDLPCGCGGTGHWESVCGGANIPAYARHVHDDEDTALPLDDDDFSAADVFDAPDDPLAARVLADVGRCNALGIAAAVHAYDPELVVLGGAIATNNPELVLEPVRDRLPDLVVGDAPAVRVTHLDNPVLHGAAAAALDRLPENPEDGDATDATRPEG